MSRVVSRPVPVGPALRLQLMWLASPALPVGGFSYSEGLEAAIDAGRVQDETTATHWLRDQMHLTLARSELPVLAAALPAWVRHDLARVRELNDWMVQTRESSELRLQTEQMGRSLVEWLRTRAQCAPSAGPDDRLHSCATLPPAPTWPVAFALAVAQSLPTGASANQTTLREALLSYTFGWAENLVQAAIKAVPFGQSAGQRILQGLLDDIPQVIDHALSLTDSQRQAFTPMLAILSARHEHQYSRLFRS